jgi:hypothetical protein
MIGRTAAATVILGLALSGVASAATLYSGPLTPGDDTNSLACRITNLSNQPRELTIEVFGFKHPSLPGGTGSGGDLLASATNIVQPMAILAIFFADTSTPGLTPNVCKFTGPGLKSSYRATACVVPTASNPLAGSPLACVPAD